MTFDCKHEWGHYFKVKFDWFKPGPPATDGSAQQVETDTVDTGYLKDWTLIKIEGEEAVEAVQEETGKDKGKGGKAAPAKGAKGGGSTLEEITDNRPREI